MPLIFITGNSGAGKSAVRKELQKRGYEAHDTDEDGISSWYHRATGKTVDRPDDPKDRTKAWFEKHDWNMSRQKIEALAADAKNRLVFLCGTTSNEDDMLDLFDKVIYLVIDEDTLRHRLATRTDNDFGKAPDELSNILGWHQACEDRYRDYGATMVDAGRPIARVVEEILKTLS